MDWEVIKSTLGEFFNQDVVVILVSVISVCVGALIILSKTSWGKKAIEWCKGKLAEIAKTANETNQKVKEVEKLATEQIDALKGEYEAKIRVVVSYFELQEAAFTTIVELIPNAKVQKELKYYKDEVEEKKKEIQKVLGYTYEEIQSQIDEKVNDVKASITKKERELDASIEKAYTLLALLEEKASDQLVEGTNDGEEREEREEREDSDPKEKAI